MSLEIIDCDQGSDAWFQARLGIPTASKFADCISKGRGSQPSKIRRKYMLELLGERMTGEIADGFSNRHTERGTAMEPDAREAYALITDYEPQQIGFIRNGEKGCSPDSLIDSDGLLEIKTKLPHLHLDAMLKNELPPEHKPQVQGQIWTAEREWCDFMSYWPGLPPFIIRIYRDNKYIEEALAPGVERFIEELLELEQKLATA